MSRSRKKRPFESICGGASAKRDKRTAARGVRRVQKLALQVAGDHDNLLLPHRYECPWNETWSWGRDGKQHYSALTARDWAQFLASREGEWPPRWFDKMMRK